MATIKYTLSTGCFSVFSVTVYPLPAPITGPHTVCVGSSITLSDASATVAWVWTSSNPAKATVTPSTGIVTGVSAGNVIITFTLSTGCYVTYTVTVNPLPLPIYGTDHVCVGATTTLHDTTAAGTVAVGTWSSINPSKGTISTTGVVTGISAGLDTIRFILPVTGCYAQDVVTVTSDTCGFNCWHPYSYL